MSRSEAEKSLLQPENPNGAFLIRTSMTRKNSLSLSLRDVNSVKHYRIQRLDDGGYYISSKVTFHTIQELVAYYKKAGGLAQRLSDPCIQSASQLSHHSDAKINRRWLERLML